MAKYLIRFDDICPTMRWTVWESIERILLDNKITPLLAVIPQNQDPKLHFEPERQDFWDRVREWQCRGWTIGMHGYQHLYASRMSGLVGIKNSSEFAGLPQEDQRSKLKVAKETFLKEGVRPDLWIAPGHSFDEITLHELREIGINCLSDGFLIYPSLDRHNTLWIPQQLWRFRRVPFGVWTVCLHHNQWTSSSLRKFARDVARFRDQITCFQDVILNYGQRRRSLFNAAMSGILRPLIHFKLRRASPETNQSL